MGRLHSIRVLERAKLTDESKVRLWQPHIVDSLAELQRQHQSGGRSLGIIRPDPDSLRFSWKAADAEEQDDARAATRAILWRPCETFPS